MITVPEYLRGFVRERSHAIAEEMPCYEDEGVATEDAVDQANILSMTLDSLDAIAMAEWNVLTRIHGRDEAFDALLPYTCTP